VLAVAVPVYVGLLAGYPALTAPGVNPVTSPASVLVIPCVNPVLPLPAAPLVPLAVG
jgi:hypothetical protein